MDKETMYNTLLNKIIWLTTANRCLQEQLEEFQEECYELEEELEELQKEYDELEAELARYKGGKTDE